MVSLRESGASAAAPLFVRAGSMADSEAVRTALREAAAHRESAPRSETKWSADQHGVSQRQQRCGLERGRRGLPHTTVEASVMHLQQQLYNPPEIVLNLLSDLSEDASGRSRRSR